LPSNPQINIGFSIPTFPQRLKKLYLLFIMYFIAVFKKLGNPRCEKVGNLSKFDD
jgi:hypothetical protein